MLGHLKAISALGQNQGSHSLGFYPRLGPLYDHDLFVCPAALGGCRGWGSLQGCVLRAQQDGTLSDCRI